MAQDTNHTARTRFPDIHTASWEHPTDRAALGALQKIPGFDQLLRKVIGTFGEKNIRMLFQANAVKVGPDQYPEIHEQLKRVCDVMDTDVPPLYISQGPIANAGAVGVDNPFIVLNSSLIELATPAELEAVIGHEVGHIMSDHSLYRTMLFILLNLAGMRSPLITMGMRPIIFALLEWSRKAEISCDRAGLLAGQDVDASLGVLGMLAGGIRGEDHNLNLESFIEQSDEYRNAEGLASYYKFMSMLGQTHPFAVVRVAELRGWIESGDYHRIMAGDYRRRSDPDDYAQDAATAAAGFGRTAVKVLEDTERYVNRTMGKFIDAVQDAFDDDGANNGGNNGGDSAGGADTGDAAGASGSADSNGSSGKRDVPDDDDPLDGYMDDWPMRE